VTEVEVVRCGLLRTVAVSTVAILAAITAPLNAFAGATYYVSPSGNDGNPGTAAAPWRTVTKAANTLTAGSTVIVKPGTYYESLIPARSGAADNLITFKAETQGTAVLDGQNSRANGVDVKRTPASYIRIDGFEIRNFTSSAVYLNDWGTALTAGIEVANCSIHDNAGDALNFRNSKDSLIDNCDIYSNGKTAIAVGGKTGSINLVVRGCKIHNNVQDGFQGNSTNSVVEYCTFYDQWWGTTHQDAFQLDAYTNLTIRYNVVSDFTQLVYGGPASGDVGVCDGLYVYGNVFFDSQYWAGKGGTCPAIFIDSSKGAAGSTILHTQIYNNTFLYLGDGQKPVLLYGSSGTRIDDVRIYNNVYYQCRGTAGGNTYDIGSQATNVRCDYNCYYNMLPMPGQDAHSIRTNPKLTSYTQGAATFDVRLQADSPCIGAGAASLASLVTLPTPFLDLDGCVLPVAGRYDIGAYAVPSEGGSIPGDANGDGVVDVVDVLVLVDSFGKYSGQAGFNPACDFGNDGAVDVYDLLVIVDNFGK
jgi:hypothetical protein